MHTSGWAAGCEPTVGEGAADTTGGVAGVGAPGAASCSLWLPQPAAMSRQAKARPGLSQRAAGCRV